MSCRESEFVLRQSGDQFGVLDRRLSDSCSSRHVNCHAVKSRQVDQHSTIAQRGTDPAMAACADGDAQPARARELNSLHHVGIRRDRNNDVRKSLGDALIPDHAASRRLIVGISPPHCCHQCLLVKGRNTRRSSLLIRTFSIDPGLIDIAIVTASHNAK